MRLQSSSSKQARHLFHASIDVVAGNCAVAMSPQTSCAPQHETNLFAFNVFAGTAQQNFRGSAFKPVMQMPGDLRPVSGQARLVPKVPSMLFELEVRTVDTQCLLDTITRWIEPRADCQASRPAFCTGADDGSKHSPRL
jgi:hypothetical protein